MKPPTRAQVLGALAIVTIVTQAVIIWRLSQRAGSKSADGSAGPAGTSGNSEADLKAQNRHLMAEVRQLRAEAGITCKTQAGPATETGVVERLRVLMDSRKYGIFAGVSPVTNGRGDLNPRFVDLFGLTPAERDRLQAALAEARSSQDRVDAENTTTRQVNDETFVMEIKSSPEAGGVIYDKLIADFAQTLGAERNRAFLALSVNAMEHHMGEFGTRERTITVTWQPHANAYEVREQHKQGSSGSSSTVLYRDLDQLAKAHPEVDRALPAPMRAKIAESIR